MGDVGMLEVGPERVLGGELRSDWESCFLSWALKSKTAWKGL